MNSITTLRGAAAELVAFERLRLRPNVEFTEGAVAYLERRAREEAVPDLRPTSPAEDLEAFRRLHKRPHVLFTEGALTYLERDAPVAEGHDRSAGPPESRNPPSAKPKEAAHPSVLPDGAESTADMAVAWGRLSDPVFLEKLKKEARFLTRSEAARDDLVQDTLVLCASAMARGKYNEDGSLTAWAKVVMRNRLSTQRRNSKDNVTTELDAVDIDTLGHVGPAQEPALLLSQVSNLTRRLPELYRVALTRAAQGIEEAEHGEMAGISRGAVKSRLFRARQLLKKHL